MGTMEFWPFEFVTHLAFLIAFICLLKYFLDWTHGKKDQIYQFLIKSLPCMSSRFSSCS